MDKMERAMQIATESQNREHYKDLCRKGNENRLYLALKRDFKGRKVLDKTLKAYVEELKKEVAKEKLQQQGK